MFEKLAYFFKWLFIPEPQWIQEQIDAISALAEEKLGLFSWLYNTLSNFFACFTNLKDYTGLTLNLPNGDTAVLLNGPLWKEAMAFINPVLTCGFALMFCVFLFHKVIKMFHI